MANKLTNTINENQLEATNSMSFDTLLLLRLTVCNIQLRTSFVWCDEDNSIHHSQKIYVLCTIETNLPIISMFEFTF